MAHRTCVPPSRGLAFLNGFPAGDSKCGSNNESNLEGGMIGEREELATEKLRSLCIASGVIRMPQVCHPGGRPGSGDPIVASYHEKVKFKLNTNTS